MADKDLLTATVQLIAVNNALTLTSEALGAAHGFLDTVRAEASESVLSEADEELGEATHAFILKTQEVLVEVSEGLTTALAEVAALGDDYKLPTPDGDDEAPGYDDSGLYL